MTKPASKSFLSALAKSSESKRTQPKGWRRGSAKNASKRAWKARKRTRPTPIECDKECGLVFHMTGGEHRTDCAVWKALNPAPADRSDVFWSGQLPVGGQVLVRPIEVRSHEGSCGACERPATIKVILDPGYGQTFSFRLCDQHAADVRIGLERTILR